jgi:hypothetical protein
VPVVAEAEAVESAIGATIDVSVIALADVSVDIIDVESAEPVDSVFFDSQAVARAITDSAKNAEVAKPFMVVIVLAVNY